VKLLTSLVLTVLAGMVLAGCGQTSADSLIATTANAPKPPNRVVVYYMHRTVRCVSCLWMEATTRQALQESFPSELASGRLELKVEDYQKREDLAKQYGVYTVSVLVVNVADGKEASHQGLERVWELKGKNDEFRAYITEAVRAALGKTQ
jgi:hypothetical protein